MTCAYWTKHVIEHHYIITAAKMPGHEHEGDTVTIPMVHWQENGMAYDAR